MRKEGPRQAPSHRRAHCGDGRAGGDSERTPALSADPASTRATGGTPAARRSSREAGLSSSARRTPSSDARSLKLRTAFGGHEVDAEETNEVYVGTRPQHRLARAPRPRARGDRTLRWKGLDLLAALPGMHARVAAHPPSSDAFLPLRDREHPPRALAGTPRHDVVPPSRRQPDNFNWQVHGRSSSLLVPPSRKDCPLRVRKRRVADQSLPAGAGALSALLVTRIRSRRRSSPATSC